MAQALFCPVCNDAHATPYLAHNKVYCASCKNELTVSSDYTEKPAATEKTTEVAKRDRSEQIKHMRSSLQHSARIVTEQLSVPAKSPGKADSTKVDRRPSVKAAVKTQHKSQMAKRAAWKPIAICLVLFVMAWALYPAPTVVEQCLTDFGKRLSGEMMADGDRIAGHRARMLLSTRDGYEAAPVILNIDQAQIGAPHMIEISKVAAAYDDVIGKMVCNRRFAMWHEIGQAERIEKEWSIYEPKNSVEGFYLILKRKGISFMRFADVHASLVSKGFDDKTTYVLSLLLVGTMQDEQWYAQVFGDKSSSGSLYVWEIAGSDGNMLIDAGGYIDVTVTQSYCGLLLGMSPLDENHVRVCRVLDLRLAEDMNGFYTRTANPMLVAAYESVRRLAREGKMSEREQRRLAVQEH